ncbi:MAG: hypothetical protein WC831_06035 [Parcubacteria group bacterium]|jgi:hypothetical protein
MKAKNIIYISLSVIFLSLSAVGIGWLVKQEIEKGKQENQKQSLPISRMNNFQEKESQSNAVAGEVVVRSKDEAKKALDDVESLMDSAEESDSAENQIDAQ